MRCAACERARQTRVVIAHHYSISVVLESPRSTPISNRPKSELEFEGSALVFKIKWRQYDREKPCETSMTVVVVLCTVLSPLCDFGVSHTRIAHPKQRGGDTSDTMYRVVSLYIAVSQCIAMHRNVSDVSRAEDA